MTPEAYRPTTWREIVGQPVEEIRRRVSPDGPNFLLYGPPGTGKTTTAYRIARDLHGDLGELMEYNASDDRGIDTVRDDIIPAAKQTTLSGLPRVIFLDEMDSMTVDAQQALRQPMEQGNAVFVLACNDASAVHDAIKSRCYTVEYEPLTRQAIITRLDQLNDQHDLGLSADQIESIASFANGDMRAALHHLADPPEPNRDTSDGQSLEAEAQTYIHGEN